MVRYTLNFFKPWLHKFKMEGAENMCYVFIAPKLSPRTSPLLVSFFKLHLFCKDNDQPLAKYRVIFLTAPPPLSVPKLKTANEPTGAAVL